MKIAVSGERLGRALPSTLNISINYFRPVSVKGAVAHGITPSQKIEQVLSNKALDYIFYTNM